MGPDDRATGRGTAFGRRSRSGRDLQPGRHEVGAGGVSAAVRWWDAASGVPGGTLASGFPGWVNELTFSPDGNTLVSATDGGVQLWDTASGRPRGSPLSLDQRFGATFTADGAQVVSVGENGVQRWELRLEVLLSAACRVANRISPSTNGCDSPVRKRRTQPRADSGAAAS